MSIVLYVMKEVIISTPFHSIQWEEKTFSCKKEKKNKPRLDLILARDCEILILSELGLRFFRMNHRH